MKFAKLLLGATLFLGMSVFAQDDECTRYQAIAGNAYQVKNYEKVTAAYNRALIECGGLEMKFFNPYIYSIKQAMGKAPDAAGKAAYLDTLIYVYEKAQEQHGIQKDWQSYLAYYYLTQGKPEAMEKADVAYQVGIHFDGVKANEGMIKQYYANLYNLWAQTSDEEKKSAYKKRIITEYFKLNDYVSKGGMKSDVSEFLSIYIDKVANDCSVITPEINNFLSELPQELESKKVMVNNFMTLLKNKDCTSSKEFAMLVDTIIKIDPSVGAVLAKAELLTAQGKVSEAVKTFESALEMTTDAAQKSEIELSIAESYYKARSYKAAHNAGLRVSGAQSARGYEIAAGSVNAMMNDCGASTFERKANNYYAVELAEKSGKSRLVEVYKSQCPSSSDLFNVGKDVGESVTLDCWGKTMTVKLY
jgi:tetratricopeptide (TPR) repeat protein